MENILTEEKIFPCSISCKINSWNSREAISADLETLFNITNSWKIIVKQKIIKNKSRILQYIALTLLQNFEKIILVIWESFKYSFADIFRLGVPPLPLSLFWRNISNFPSSKSTFVLCAFLCLEPCCQWCMWKSAVSRPILVSGNLPSGHPWLLEIYYVHMWVR